MLDNVDAIPQPSSRIKHPDIIIFRFAGANESAPAILTAQF